jgi:hypothetical protein
MDIIDQIIRDKGTLDDLYYILSANSLSLQDLAKPLAGVGVTYPTHTTTVPLVVAVAEIPTFAPYRVVAYQSALDVCVQNYGTLALLPTFLVDNSLALNDYLTPNSQVLIRNEFHKNKTSNTLFALRATVTNNDRDSKHDSDIYLGTEDGVYLGPTTSVKIKVN